MEPHLHVCMDTEGGGHPHGAPSTCVHGHKVEAILMESHLHVCMDTEGGGHPHGAPSTCVHGHSGTA